MSVANKDEALKCLDIARKYLAEGNTARAKHFAEKAKTLYTCPEIDGFLRFLQSSGNAPSSSTPKPAPAPQQSSSASAAGTSRNGNAATPAQKEMITRIRGSKGDYYKVLGVDRSADEDEIKKAYRKLALKLHPDKCQAPGAEEAFKEVSKAFSCLTDQDKRSFYDRTGHEDMASAAAARGGGGGPQFRGDHIDPQDLFNMMFGGGMNGAFGMGPMHFGGFQQHPAFRQGRRQQQQQQQQANPMAGLVSVIFPIVILLLTLLINTSSPPASMSYSREYRHQLHTAERDVPYFVRDLGRFEDTYPTASRQRQKFERSIETEFQADLQRACHMEMVHEEERQRRHRGQPAAPRELTSCDKMYAFRNRQGQAAGGSKRATHGKRPPQNIIQHDEF
eukprot:jgi/Ulvmu1/12848/UM098_0033.1